MRDMQGNGWLVVIVDIDVGGSDLTFPQSVHFPGFRLLSG